MEVKTRIVNISIESNGIVFASIQTYTEYGGQEITLENRRESFYPGQFERAKEMLTENQCNAVTVFWTPEVIAAWEAKQTALSLDAG